MANKRGIIIAFSGIDGSGKSSLLKHIGEALTARGLMVYQTKQPTPQYREHPAVVKMYETGEPGLSWEAIALLSAFDRLEQVEDLVREKMHFDVILVDRYLLDGIVAFTSKGIERAWVESINRNCPEPDIGFLIDCPGDEAHTRIVKRGAPMTADEKSIDELEKKRQLYLQCRRDHTVVLNSLLGQDAVFDLAWSVIMEKGVV